MTPSVQHQQAVSTGIGQLGVIPQERNRWRQPTRPFGRLREFGDIVVAKVALKWMRALYAYSSLAFFALRAKVAKARQPSKHPETMQLLAPLFIFATDLCVPSVCFSPYRRVCSELCYEICWHAHLGFLEQNM